MYVDRNDKTLEERSLSKPLLFIQFKGYKQPEKYKHKKACAESIKASELRCHATALLILSASSYMKIRRWSSVFAAIQEFGTSLHKYASYLESSNGRSEEKASCYYH